jgi:hypothetical protein
MVEQDKIPVKIIPAKSSIISGVNFKIQLCFAAMQVVK